MNKNSRSLECPRCKGMLIHTLTVSKSLQSGWFGNNVKPKNSSTREIIELFDK